MCCQVARSATVVVLLGNRRVRADDHAPQRTLVAQFQQDLGGDDLGDHPGELVGRTPSEHEMLPFVVGWYMAEFGPHGVVIEARRIHQAVVRVECSGELGVPLGAQGLDGVGVTIEVHDLAILGSEFVVLVLHGPDQVAELVEAHIVSRVDRFDVDDRVAEEPQSPGLVVGESARGISAVIGRTIDLVGRNADGFTQELDSEGQVPLGQFGDAYVEVGRRAGRGAGCVRHGNLRAGRAERRGRGPWLLRASP